VQKGVSDTRSKMRPGMMIVEMTMTEQQQYLRHNDNFAVCLIHSASACCSSKSEIPAELAVVFVTLKPAFANV